MAEPVTLYKGKDEQTVAAPSEVKRLLADGWTMEKPAPKPEPEPEADEKPAAKRGRKPKSE